MNHNRSTDNKEQAIESPGANQAWICPMHPEMRQQFPGLCPECGMRLVRTSSDPKPHAGRDKHAGHSTALFKKKFWMSLALTVPVVLYSELPERFFGWRAPGFSGSAYLPLVFGSLVFFYGGWVFLGGAWRELRGRLPGMMTLIALAIVSAYSYSVYVTLQGGEHTLFWELATLVTVMLLGHWIEMKAVQGAQGALGELSKLLPDTAEVVYEGKATTVPLSALRMNDVVLVRPGGKVPADGVILEGASEVNESLVTGESRPVSKKGGDEVIAGTVNGDGALTIRVTKIGEHTFLAGVMRLVEEAQASKSRLQILADRAALYLTVIAIVVGGGAFSGWLWAGVGVVFAVERLVAVLVVACPHALGLAVPLVASISTTLAARNGFLVRERLALENARNVDTVLFDKTGTLTKGEYGVQKIWSVDSISENEVLRLAASVDAHSEHFVAKAIVRKAEEASLTLSPVKDFARLPGKGVRVTIGGAEVRVGGATLLGEMKVRLPGSIGEALEAENEKGKTIIFVFRNNALVGALALNDIVREESRQAVVDLKRMGIRIAMVTGDSDDVARWVAEELSIDEYFSEVLPHEKSEKVKILQSKGHVVAMVGDGVNDAPALTQAELGIAVGAGTSVAIESAGIILVRNDPRDIPKIIRLSRLTYRKMMQNLFWATGYNVVAMPLAAGALAYQGILFQPAFAAVLMSLSTVIVAVNAVLLKRSVL